jgi:hypothetical protein
MTDDQEADMADLDAIAAVKALVQENKSLRDRLAKVNQQIIESGIALKESTTLVEELKRAVSAGRDRLTQAYSDLAASDDELAALKAHPPTIVVTTKQLDKIKKKDKSNK